jgi:hypothetical protein
MSNTSTIRQSTYIKGDIYIDYANDETAVVGQDRISSLPKNSSAIEYWNYNTKTNGLCVQYKSSDTFYWYEGVPFVTIFALMNADSLGAFIAKEIKPNFSVA